MLASLAGGDGAIEQSDPEHHAGQMQLLVKGEHLPCPLQTAAASGVLLRQHTYVCICLEASRAVVVGWWWAAHRAYSVTVAGKAT